MLLEQIIDGVMLIAITVVIHGSVLGWTLSLLPDALAKQQGSFVRIICILCALAIVVIIAHCVEIAIWGVFFAWRGIMPNFDDATYFSAVTYATIGYGDVVPPKHWRLLASMEGLTGILMCAWSGGFFFAVVAEIYKSATQEDASK